MLITFFGAIRSFISAHKMLVFFIAAVIAGGGYYGYGKLTATTGETRYVLASVQKGTLVLSVSGSGQISASTQIDLKTKASGDAIVVNMVNGQEVRAGTLVLQLDVRDAEKAVRDAEANLDSAKITFEKLKKPADALSILQAENALAQAKESKQTAEDNLKKAYDEGFNDVSNAFLDLPSVMTGIQDLIYGTTLAVGQSNLSFYADSVRTYNEAKAIQYKDDTAAAYKKARDSYDKNFADYKSAGRFSDTKIVESLITETYETSKNFAEAVKNTNNLIQLYEDELAKRSIKPNPVADTHLTSLTGYTSKTNTHLSTLLAIKNTLQNNQDTIVNAGRSIEEKTESLSKLKAGADTLDIQSQELAIKQRENALLDVREKLADYYIYAPFNGIIAKLNVKRMDPVSPSTVVATLITKQKVAEISLNEVDVAKVHIGQKATLTFDALEGLSLTGHTAEIDTMGTVTQGVVTYNVKIVFDTQDERVRSGMSVSASIITDVKPDVLLAPNSAVKSQGNAHYVEIIEGSAAGNNSSGVTSAVAPKQVQVEIGISNDSSTEIVSGIGEGQSVVSRTITANSAQAIQQTSGLNLLRGPGGGGGRNPAGGR